MIGSNAFQVNKNAEVKSKKVFGNCSEYLFRLNKVLDGLELTSARGHFEPVEK